MLSGKKDQSQKVTYFIGSIHITFLGFFFIFGCFGSPLLRTGFLQLQQAGATPCCSVQASHCGGLAYCGAQVLGARASAVAAHRLSSCGSWAPERRLSSCGTWAQLLRGMWDLLGPGLEPVSPALAGGLLTTAPPGKSLCNILEMTKLYRWRTD